MIQNKIHRVKSDILRSFATGALGEAIFIFFMSAIIFDIYIASHSLLAGHWQFVPHISRYPWTDMAENIVIGFNLANGLQFGRETIVTHLPGVPQYLSIFIKIFGLSEGTPSRNILDLSYLVSNWATTLLNLGCLHLALRLIGVGRSLAAAAAFILILLLGFMYDYNWPMSENVIPFIFLLQFICFAKCLDGTETLPRLLVSAAWGLTFLPLVNLLAGLTIAPSVAFLWVSTFIVVFFRARSAGWPAVLVAARSKGVLSAVGLSLGVLGYEIGTLDLGATYFWAVSVTRDYVITEPFGSMVENILQRQAHNPNPHLIGSTLYELGLSVLAYLAVSLWKGHRDFSRTAILLVVSFSVVVLSYWRFTIGYKSEVAFGVSWYFFIRACVLAWPDIAVKEVRARVAPLLFTGGLFTGGATLVALAVICAVKVDKWADRLPPRNAALDQANVCRFRSSADCRCLQVTIFGPQFFLEHDVRQCTNRYSTFSPDIFRNKTVKEQLIADIDRRDVAFLVLPPGKLSLKDKDMDPAIRQAFYNGGLNCDKFVADWKICYKP